MNDSRGKPQVFVNVRRQARELAARLVEGDYQLELTAQDVAFLLYCRVLEHGTIETLTVVNGVPAVAIQSVNRVDFSKEMKLQP